MANPMHIKYFAGAINQKAKTDKLDAPFDFSKYL